MNENLNTSPAAPDGGQIKKLMRGERIGFAAFLVCAATLVFFTVTFTLSRTNDDLTLFVTSIAVTVPLAIISVTVAAYCNVKFGGKIEKICDRYVVDALAANAALMHPERDELHFQLSFEGTSAVIKVNNYHETIKLDFSAFGKLTISRKNMLTDVIEKRICATFIRLFERGGRYRKVSYSEILGSKKGKAIPVIEDGVPTKKAMKNFLRNN